MEKGWETLSLSTQLSHDTSLKVTFNMTLTTEEAENIINSHKKSDEGYDQWMEKVSREGLEGKQSSIFYEFP